MSNSLPKATIIVPVYNGQSTIKLCVESLLASDYPKDQLEIIIVDNASNDETREIVEKYPIKCFTEQRKTSYAARNNGIRNSTGSIIAFTDADCIVDQEWLRNGVNRFVNSNAHGEKNIGAIAGRIEAYQPWSIIEKYTAHANVLDQEKILAKARRLATCNAFFKREVFDKYGLFDEELYSGGDTEMSWRLISHGYAISYCEEAVIFHKHRSNLLDLYLQFFKYGYGSVFLFRKYNKEDWVDFEKSWKEICQILASSPFSENRTYSLLDFVTKTAYLTGQWLYCSKDKLFPILK